jgi:hypothetical protein
MYLCTDRAAISVKDSDRSRPGAPGAVSVCKCPYICSMFRAVVTSRVGGGSRYRPHPDASRSCWSGLRASAPRPRLTKLVCNCVTRTASAARYKHGSQRQVNVMRASCVKQLQRVVREPCRAARRLQAGGHGLPPTPEPGQRRIPPWCRHPGTDPGYQLRRVAGRWRPVEIASARWSPVTLRVRS